MLVGHSWKDGTAEPSAKILLDWARHTGLAPARAGPEPGVLAIGPNGRMPGDRNGQ
jgi:hypothetical protein